MNSQPNYWRKDTDTNYIHDLSVKQDVEASDPELHGPFVGDIQLEVERNIVIVRQKSNNLVTSIRMNRGQARWFGVRLIEAAGIQEVTEDIS